ncbi:MAG TPA: SRPBCC domain-containing protein, partial [Allosphingosinicella sp.]
STTWRRVGDDAYEARITSSADPTESGLVRYTRLDRAPVQADVTSEADGTRTLTHEVVVPATAEEVYRAVTTPDGWATWAVRSAWASPSDPDLMETSYVPGAAPGDSRNIRQRYLLRVPNRLVAFRTVQAPTGFPHAEDFYRVTHIIELEPAGGGTRVRLTSAGYPAGAAGDTLVGFFREGNRTSLDQLRTRFVSGPLDWTRRQQTAGH